MKQFTLSLLLCVTGMTSGTVTAVNKDEPVILGQGEFRYRYRADKLVVPTSLSASWQHVHGLTLTPSNEIMVTYTTDGEHNQSTRGLISFTLRGDFIETRGSLDMARGAPHGLDGQREGEDFFLYHSNNAGRVFKTRTNGELLWSLDTPPPLPAYEASIGENIQGWIIDVAYREFSYNLTLFPTAYMPCNIAFHPEESALYLADCYGSSYIHKYSTVDGSYLGLSFGGSGAEAGKFNTPHGLIYDQRFGQLLVADRGNSRLQYLDFDGNPQSVVQADDIQQPCDFDLLGEYMLVPDLAGHLLILDGNNEVISRLNVAEILYDDGVIYPHDAIFLPNHDIILATWNPGTLTYWERIKE